MKLTVEATGLINGHAFIWDGTRWRFLGTGDFAGGGYRLLASPVAPATAFLQSGQFNVLFIGNNPGTPTFQRAPVCLSRLPIKPNVCFANVRMPSYIERR